MKAFNNLQLVYDATSGDYCFEDVKLAETHNPQGPSEAKRETFIVAHGLKESSSRQWPGWGMLVPKKYRAECREYGTNRYEPRGRFSVMAPPVTDHDELFCAPNRGYVWITQPYSLSLSIFEKLWSLWTGMGRYVNVSYADAWWYPGLTPLITISDFPIKLTEDVQNRSA